MVVVSVEGAVGVVVAGAVDVSGAVVTGAVAVAGTVELAVDATTFPADVVVAVTVDTVAMTLGADVGTPRTGPTVNAGPSDGSALGVLVKAVTVG